MNEIQKTPWHFLLWAIIAGESIFLIPFVLPRIFRPTFLKTFHLNNLELGICFSFYGIIALVCYLFGGPIADRFRPGKLIASGMWATALGGVILVMFPNYETLKYVYAYWGFSTIFLCWAPIIKLTRIWGEDKSQIKAFSYFDAGRGILGTIFSYLGIYTLSLYLTKDQLNTNNEELYKTFLNVILGYSICIAILGVVILRVLRITPENYNKIQSNKITKSQFTEIIKLPATILLTIILLCAYMGYKTLDLLTQYAQEIMNYDTISSANIGTLLLILRPITGILIGYIAHKINAIIFMIYSFLFMIIGSFLIATGQIIPDNNILFIASILVFGIGVCGVRCLYFTILKTGNIPLKLTGTAIGIVSIIGFTPDIFHGLLVGYLLDHHKGIEGYQYIFYILLIVSIVGCICSYISYRIFEKKNNDIDLKKAIITEN